MPPAPCCVSSRRPNRLSMYGSDCRLVSPVPSGILTLSGQSVEAGVDLSPVPSPKEGGVTCHSPIGWQASLGVTNEAPPPRAGEGTGGEVHLPRSTARHVCA